MAQSIFLWQMDQYLLEALHSGAISYREAQQLAFFDLMMDHLPEQNLPEVPPHLWPILDKISLSQTQGLRH